MSGRKGITVSADEVIAEAQSRALALTPETLESRDDVAKIIGLGALKFAFLKASPERQIDFRWDSALALQGDTAPVASTFSAEQELTAWNSADVDAALADLLDDGLLLSSAAKSLLRAT